MTVKKMITSLGLLALVWATQASANEIVAWRKAVVKTVIKNQSYPDSAISRGIEGVAKVRIQIDRSGTITSYELTQPTGQTVLDREIPKLMTKIDPLPAPPDSLPVEQLTFVFPLSWKLR